MQLIKHLTILFSFLFSYNVLAINYTFFCTNNNNYTLERYDNLQQQIEKSSDIDSIYHLAQVSFCLEKEEEGITHLQKAADADHIVANFVLGVYHRNNHSFNPKNMTNDLENWNQNIYYFTKAVQIIKSLPNYPQNTTDETIFRESRNHISYHIFASLPDLYLTKYYLIIDNIINNNTNYTNETLDTLNKMNEAATQCLNRPAVSVWNKNKENIYKKQQTKCNTLLTAVKTIYPLEQQRTQIIKSCTEPLKGCTKHNEMLYKILQSIDFFLEMIKQSEVPQSDV